jgi:hypothetical protein
MQLVTGGTFPRGQKNIHISYLGGYDPIPDRVREAVKMISTALFSQCGRDPFVVSTEAGRVQAIPRHDRRVRAPRNGRDAPEPFRRRCRRPSTLRRAAVASGGMATRQWMN